MRNLHIALAVIIAISIAMYVELGLSYYFDGIGLMPTICTAVVISLLTILALISYNNGYHRSYSKE